MNKSKLIALIALALFASLLISACNRGEGAKSSQKTIAVIPKGVSHSFWQTVKAGAEAAGKDLN
ncbi:MAG: BMP family ABC transporter substrate-binding protein, partial [Blastocatellia bacterium]